MAKSLYLGVANVAKKGKKAYIGVANVARKIKKMYIGVAGVARLFFSGGEAKYYGTTATNLASAKQCMAGASTTNHALFAGSSSATGDWTIEVYDASLTKSTKSNGFAMTKGAGASLNGSAFFHGSYSSNYYSVFNASLTKTDLTNGCTKRTDLGAASNSSYVLFGGGYDNNNWSNVISSLDTYNSSLTKVTNPGLSEPSVSMGTASTSNYAAFYTSATKIDVFNTSLTRTVLSNSSGTIKCSSGTGFGELMLFAGGGTYSNVDAYNGSLTKISVTALSVARNLIAAKSHGGFAFFCGGGINGIGTASNAVDIYDQSLTRTTATLATARMQIGAAVVGNYVLFAGGYNGSAALNTVEAYVVN